MCLPGDLIRPTDNAASDTSSDQSERGDRSDTVGAIAITVDGVATAAISSGGVRSKHDGRIGHASQFGAGVWAERRDDRAVAVCTSGLGELLTRTQLAKRLGQRLLELKDGEVPAAVIQELLNTEFLGNPLVTGFCDSSLRKAGGVILFWEKGSDVGESIVFHNTRYLAHACRGVNKVTKALSKHAEGESFYVDGTRVLLVNRKKDK
ncbi:hypothetical protein L596_020174 [Steinernema carpocapsae]|uniref:Asparaginase n=1 Tax=Steinernema carpocapsae TaxID=34508 RepID=A0A4U5MST4_STECR|nr:hypothetical protein L596_020174 [Steinernema carpocapsae]